MSRPIDGIKATDEWWKHLRKMGRRQAWKRVRRAIAKQIREQVREYYA